MRETVELQPMIEAEFVKGGNVRDYVPAIQAIVQCFALSFGYPAHPTGLRVHYLSRADQDRQREAKTFGGPFDTHYHWDKFAELSDRAWVGNAVIQVTNEVEKTAAKSVLKAWVERRKEWRSAYTRQYEALRSRNRIDRNRFVNAFAWVEAIPDKAKSKDFAQAKIKAMIDAAMDASGLKTDDRRVSRIKNSLGGLVNESAAPRLLRLIASVRRVFGATLVPEGLDKDCLEAVPLRNSAAHGDIDWSEVDIHKFMRVISALEALAFLLTIRDLPISDEAKRRIRHHPLMEYLEYSHVVDVSSAES